VRLQLHTVIDSDPDISVAYQQSEIEHGVSDKEVGLLELFEFFIVVQHVALNSTSFMAPKGE
jgi:hypothetical protein